VSSDAEGVGGVEVDAHHFRFALTFHDLGLLPGQYQLQVHAMDPEALRVCDTRESVFSVVGDLDGFGFVRLPHSWH